MQQTSPCPEPGDLLRLTLGQVPEPEAGPLGQHLLSCPHCADTLNHLRAKDTLIDALRGNRDTFPPDLPVVEALMDRLALTPPPMSPDDTTGPLSVEASPRQIGRYRILGLLGEGGMGTVYHAHDEQLRRDVAIKVPRFDGPQAKVAAARQRFLREARAAAAVRHPHVCPIYDVSEQEDRPFVVMAQVEGCSLAERLQEGAFADCRAAVALVSQVADGLSAVHAAGIVHRDLKPGNILLDSTGQALLTDFGLARAECDSEHVTAEGTLLGTPAYMAPEQVEPDLGVVGQAADQYSLAVVLYQMLTGRLPFEGSIMSLMGQIATKTPPPPSQYRPDLGGTLERILLTAMARRPQDRYPSVTQFQRALLDWREKQPVGGPPSLPVPLPTAPPVPEATVKTLPHAATGPRGSRRRWLVAAALMLVGGLFAAQIIIRYQDREGETREITLPEGAKNPEIVPPPLAPVPQGEPLGPLALVGQPAKIDGVQSWTVETIGHRGVIVSVAYRPDGKVLASAGEDGVLRTWDATTGEHLRFFVLPSAPGPGQYGRQVLAWSPDGKTLAVGDATTGRITRVNAETGATQPLGPSDSPCCGLAWSPDGKLLASAHPSGVRVWEVSRDEMVLPQLAAPASLGTPAVIFSPEGKTVLVGSKDLREWDLKTGKLIRTLAEPDVQYNHHFAWSPDGKTLAIGNRLWDRKLDKTRVLGPLTNKSVPVSWSADGKSLTWLVDGGYQGWATWVVATGKRQQTPSPGLGTLDPHAFSPDGTRLAGTSWRGNHLDCYDLSSGKRLFTGSGHRSWTHARSETISPDGRTLATRWGEATSRWDLPSGRLSRTRLNGPDIRAWSPDGKVVLSREGRLWDAEKLEPLATQFLERHETANVASGVWSPKGNRFALWVRAESPVVILDARTGKEIDRLTPGIRGNQLSLSWSPDGKRLAVSGGNGTILFDTEKKQKSLRLPPDGDAPVAWSPDGKLVAASWLVFDSATGEHLHRARFARQRPPFPGTLAASSILFSPDGKWLADNGGPGQTVRIWEVATWKKPHQFAQFGLMRPLAWLAGSRTLAASSKIGIYFLDIETDKVQGTLVPMSNSQGLAVNAEGHYRGTPKIENEIVYIVQTAKGQETLTADEFASKYRWNNDPDRVYLTGR